MLMVRKFAVSYGSPNNLLILLLMAPVVVKMIITTANIVLWWAAVIIKMIIAAINPVLLVLGLVMEYQQVCMQLLHNIRLFCD